MLSPERFYEQFGLTRRPAEHGGEQLFWFRARCETTLGLPMVDPNALRDRLYRMWARRAVRPLA